MPATHQTLEQRQYWGRIAGKKGGAARWPNGPRFWCFVPMTNGSNACWEWLGPVKRSKDGRFGGYGHTSYQGRNMKPSRAMWLRMKGPIPKGMEVCHRCDNRACVNPAHLFLATHAENMQDCAKKRRLYWQRPDAIRAGGPIVLDEEKVAEILRLSTEGMTGTEIAERFGVTCVAIYSILCGRTWRHVPRPANFARPSRDAWLREQAGGNGASPVRLAAVRRTQAIEHSCECGRVVKGNAIGSHRKACRRRASA